MNELKILNFKSLLRFFILSWHYKKGFLSFFLRYLRLLPFLSYEVIRVEDCNKEKTISKGHITKGKKIYLKFFNLIIIKFILLKGEVLTAEHFYFNRSVKDLKFFLRKTKKYLNINSESIIFDPACGTGKHLMYITDKYNCKGIGIDIYPKAINVSKKIEKYSNCNFLIGNSCDQNTLILLSNYSKNINTLFINSWVSYVYKNNDFNNFLSFIKKLNCKIMIIAQKKDDLKSIFKTKKILFQKFVNNTQYAILEL